MDDEFHSEKSNLIAQTSCCQQALNDALVNRQVRQSTTHTFNTKVIYDTNKWVLLFFSFVFTNDLWFER